MNVEIDDQELDDILIALSVRKSSLKENGTATYENLSRLSKLSDKLKLIRMGRGIFSK